MNEPTIRLTDSAFRGHTRMYDVDVLYYDSPESDIHRLFTDDNDNEIYIEGLDDPRVPRHDNDSNHDNDNDS